MNDASLANNLIKVLKILNINSDKEVKIYDNSGNTFFVNEFKYQIKKQSFNGSNTKFIDKEKNEYLISVLKNEIKISLKDKKLLFLINHFLIIIKMIQDLKRIHFTQRIIFPL